MGGGSLTPYSMYRCFFVLHRDICNSLVYIPEKVPKPTTFNEFVNNLSKISSRETNDYLLTSHNQLISFLRECMDEVTVQGEFVKYANNAFVAKYKVLAIIGITVVVAVTLHLLCN